MSFSRFLLWISLLPLVPAAAAAQDAGGSASGDDVVATVGKLRITRRDLLAEVNRLIPLSYYHSRVPPERMAEFRRKALESLVEKALIHLDAIDRGIRVTDEDVAERFEKTLQKAGPRFASLPEEKKQALLEQYRSMVVRRILIDRNEARFRASLPKVSEEEVARRYEEIKDSLLAPPEAHLRHILVKVSPSAGEDEIRERRKRIEQARERILSGEPFEKVAKEVSEDIYAARGGDLGVVKRGSFLHGPVDAAAFELKEGELSKVLDSIYGFHLLQCVKKLPRRKLTLEEVRDRIRARLEATLRERERARWLAELRRRHPVRILASDLAAPPTSRPTPPPAPKTGKGR